MIFYFLIFLYPVIAYFFLSNQGRHVDNLAFTFFGFILIIFIGLRYEVGGDWEVYEHINTLYRGVEGLSFGDLFQFKYLTGDFGYILFNWIGFNFGYGVTTTNLLVAIVFVVTLFKFANYTQNRWLALIVSVPYMITVVSMGYTRQSAALGLVMVAYILINKNKLFYFFFTILIAGLFHTSALIIGLLGILIRFDKNGSFFKKLFFVIVLSILAMYFSNYIDSRILHYISNPHTTSSGAMYRIFLSVVAVIIFFYFKKDFAQKFNDASFWNLFSWLIILSLFFVFNLSVVVDRLAVYALPIQMIVFSRLPLLIEDINLRLFSVFSVILLYFLVHFLWLYFGIHTVYWLPYKNFLFI